MNISVAVISDLHVGSGSRATDFSLPGSSVSSIDNYLDRYKSFVSSNNIKANYLLVPGDITNRAGVLEFELASRRIVEIAECLGVPESKILFCPGNHDIDWETIKALSVLGHPEDQIIKSKYFNFHSAGNIFIKNIGAATGRFDVAPYLVDWEFDDLVVFSLNTAVFDDPDRKPHCGEVRPEQIDAIDKILSARLNPDKLKIFMFHHHPIQYLDSTFNIPDFSIMSNAAGLLNLLAKHQFDFVVHGHKHIPRFNMEIKNAGHPLSILCAGSFCAFLDNRYFDSVGNNFHLVEFHDRCGSSNYARGVVKTWTFFQGKGWTPSLPSPGIESQQYFGAFQPRPVLVETLRVRLEEHFKIAQYLKWDEFVLRNPDLRYYTNDALRQAIEDVSGILGITPHAMEESNLDKLVILKG